MAAGVSFKFQGSKIQVILGFAQSSPVDAIQGVSKAVEAVVSDTSHGRLSGDVIQLSNIVGMTELNGGTYIIEVLTANTYKLVGIDSTGYGTYVSGGNVASATLSNFCELTGYNRSGGSAPEIDTTSLCSTAAEFELGLPDFGTTQIDFKYAPLTNIQKQLAALQLAGTQTGVIVTLPKSGGKITQLAFVQQTSEQSAVGAIWTGSATLRNTGAPTTYAGT